MPATSHLRELFAQAKASGELVGVLVGGAWTIVGKVEEIEPHGDWVSIRKQDGSNQLTTIFAEHIVAIQQPAGEPNGRPAPR